MNEGEEETQLQSSPQPLFKPCSPLRSISSESASPPISVLSSDEPDRTCPICLEEKQDFHFIICGHKVCQECNRMLRINNCMNKCPVCRCPLNWMGYVEFDGENFVLSRDTPATVVETVMAASNDHDAVRNIVLESGLEVEGTPVRRMPEQMREGRRRVRIVQARDWECQGNLLCAILTVIFIIIFAYMSSN